jgi:hypothetical protein
MTRTDQAGTTVTLPDVTTGADGRFVVTDTLPAVDPDDFPSFAYEFTWPGTDLYDSARAMTTVYVRATD